MLKYLTTLFYPRFCSSCNILISQEHVFCFDCQKQIKPIVSRTLQVTKSKSIKVFAVSDYKNPLRKLILQKNYSQIVASRFLAQIILEKSIVKKLDFDFIVPIPLHWTRYAWRGYNQSYVISKYIGKELQKPVLNILQRKRKTVFQAELSVQQRQENVKGIFDVNFFYRFKDLEKLKNKNILLIDDLCTTGATLTNASKVLFKKITPKGINSIVACRVV